MPKTKMIRLCLAVALLSILGVTGEQVLKESRKGPQKPVPLGMGQPPPGVVPPDDGAKAKQYRKDAEQGNADAQANLGYYYYQGKGVPQDHAEAVKWFRKAADQGDTNAQCNLGVCYAQGKGVPQDHAEAVKWYRKAADQEYVAAQNCLGECYENGWGVPRNHAEAVKWYRKAADQGFADAQRNLGFCYLLGQGVPQDDAEAVKWFRKAADQGDANAQCNLGVCYDHNQGVPQDHAEAVKWYRKAADQGYIVAQNCLGYCYYQGQGVPQDKAEAVKWFRKAAEQGFGEASLKLAKCYAEGDGVPQDLAETVKWYRKAAEQGNNEAQFVIGGIYASGGGGVAKDAAEGMKWFRKAADQGFADAQFILGGIYFSGEGVPKDYAEAVKWLRKAADGGHAEALHLLSVCYANGQGVAKDAAEAAKLEAKATAQRQYALQHTDNTEFYRKAAEKRRKAAERGDAEAQFSLGCRYERGDEGHPKDDFEAVKWYRKAADQGHHNAIVYLAWCYNKGRGVRQDYAEAVRLYRKLAEQGDMGAQRYLGESYSTGTGAPQNDIEAYFWYSLSAAQGDVTSGQNRDLIAKRMSREELVEGQRRAAAFVPKKFVPAQAGESRAGTVPSSADSQPKSSGTGFFITDDGYLLSNFHVVAEAGRVMMQTKAGLLPAQVVKTDPANDLALLKVSGTSSGLPVISSRTVKLGSTVATVGFPNIGLQGFAPKLAKGEIGALTGAQDDPRYFQISVPVQPGNSGGALVDERGNVVGVVSAKLSARAALSTSGALPENVNYAVKSSFLLSFLESVPEVAAKLKESNTKDRKFEDVVKSAEQAAVLVLVY